MTTSIPPSSGNGSDDESEQKRRDRTRTQLSTVVSATRLNGAVSRLVDGRANVDELLSVLDDIGSGRGGQGRVIAEMLALKQESQALETAPFAVSVAEFIAEAARRIPISREGLASQLTAMLSAAAENPAYIPAVNGAIGELLLDLDRPLQPDTRRLLRSITEKIDQNWQLCQANPAMAEKLAQGKASTPPPRGIPSLSVPHLPENVLVSDEATSPALVEPQEIRSVGPTAPDTPAVEASSPLSPMGPGPWEKQESSSAAGGDGTPAAASSLGAGWGPEVDPQGNSAGHGVDPSRVVPVPGSWSAPSAAGQTLVMPASALPPQAVVVADPDVAGHAPFTPTPGSAHESVVSETPEVAPAAVPAVVPPDTSTQSPSGRWIAGLGGLSEVDLRTLERPDHQSSVPPPVSSNPLSAARPYTASPAVAREPLRAPLQAPRPAPKSNTNRNLVLLFVGFAIAGALGWILVGVLDPQPTAGPTAKAAPSTSVKSKRHSSKPAHSGKRPAKTPPQRSAAASAAPAPSTRAATAEVPLASASVTTPASSASAKTAPLLSAHPVPKTATERPIAPPSVRVETTPAQPTPAKATAAQPTPAKAAAAQPAPAKTTAAKPTPAKAAAAQPTPAKTAAAQPTPAKTAAPAEAASKQVVAPPVTKVAPDPGRSSGTASPGSVDQIISDLRNVANDSRLIEAKAKEIARLVARAKPQFATEILRHITPPDMLSGLEDEQTLHPIYRVTALLLSNVAMDSSDDKAVLAIEMLGLWAKNRLHGSTARWILSNLRRDPLVLARAPRRDALEHVWMPPADGKDAG